MRVLLADPPAFTPWYDHELAAALARAGADVELATSRFRFGDVPAPEGYRRTERLYPLSSRLFARSRLRLPLKGIEHVDVLRSLMLARPDVLHLQWLALGVIRPYKGLADAIEATRRLPDTRLLVAGDPAMPLDGLREAERVEWRLGYLPQAELDRALSEATVAVFPYRAELDQSGALLQALGAGVPAVVYDVGGLAEPVRAYGAGRVVPAGDVEALTEAARALLDDAPALAAARAGAERARSELTWDAAAHSHLDVYRELH